MNQFIFYYLSVSGKQFVSDEMARQIAELCLPLFFTDTFPKEKMSWSVIAEHAPICFMMAKPEVDKAILNWLEEHHPKAWFKPIFDPVASLVILNSLEEQFKK